MSISKSQKTRRRNMLTKALRNYKLNRFCSIVLRHDLQTAVWEGGGGLTRQHNFMLQPDYFVVFLLFQLHFNPQGKRVSLLCTPATPSQPSANGSVFVYVPSSAQTSSIRCWHHTAASTALEQGSISSQFSIQKVTVTVRTALAGFAKARHV